MGIRARMSFLRGAKLAIFMVILATAARSTPALADKCLKDAYGKNVQCSANDVSIAFADNPRNLDGSKLTQCTAGQKLSFVADFHVTTTATARENIGLYFQTAGGSNALTGTCSDNIIAPPHSSSNSADVITLGTAQCRATRYTWPRPARSRTSLRTARLCRSGRSRRRLPK
jgi:hypothetical protein